MNILKLHNLTPKDVNFVIEFCKDFDARRAALASGYAADTGYRIREKPAVQAAIESVLTSRLELSHIDAEWVLMEAVDNHMIARQLGNITASNTALNLIAKHARVDAFAAEKIIMASDQDVVDRLQRARKRINNDEEDVSFL